MNKWLNHLPSVSEVLVGMFLVLLGLLMSSGGGFAIQSSLEFEPHWVFFPEVEAWVCWTIVWLGFDTALFRSRATPFVLNKTLVPLLRQVVRGIREERARSEESEPKPKSGIMRLLERLQ